MNAPKKTRAKTVKAPRRLSTSQLRAVGGGWSPTVGSGLGTPSLDLDLDLHPGPLTFHQAHWDSN